jgi:2-polyprenyl-3-methyl-5-hydroxy-6-metoxy-1,4-benzoquinol methylase
MKINKKNKCPVCRSVSSYKYKGYDILYNTTNKEFHIFECVICKALFLKPFPTKEQTFAFYPTHYYSYSADDNVGFFEKVKQIIIKSKMEPQKKLSLYESILITLFKNKFSGIPLYKKRNAAFLDIGCGNGSNLKLLNKYGWKTYGIELDKNAVKHAKKQGLNVTQKSLEDASFKGVKFDCIRIWHVFEHLTDPHLAMKKLSSLLKDNGEILMAVPNTDSFARKLFGTYWYGLDVPRHVINYSPHTLTYLCAQYDLRITEVRYASVGAYIASISHFLRKNFGFTSNLINNLFLVFLTAPLDFASDLLGKGDTIFLKIKKEI